MVIELGGSVFEITHNLVGDLFRAKNAGVTAAPGVGLASLVEGATPDGGALGRRKVGKPSARRAADGPTRSGHLASGRRCYPASLLSPAPGGAGTCLRLHRWRGESLRRGGENPGDGTTISSVEAAGARLLRRSAPPRAPRPCLLRPSHEDAMCRRPRRRPPDLPGRRRRTGPAAHPLSRRRTCRRGALRRHRHHGGGDGGGMRHPRRGQLRPATT
jgi:hypothetical protein